MGYTRKKIKYRGGNLNKDHCIFVSLMKDEGLGNQLFIYAAALMVQEETNIPICMFNARTNPHSKKNYRSMFNVTALNDSLQFKKRMNNSKNVIRSGRKNVTNSWNINFNTFNKNNINTDIKISESLYQNYKAIKKIIPKMKYILEKNEFNKAIYNQYKNMIKPSETAYMHIRRGDKAKTGIANPINYYLNALMKIESNDKIKIIYVFSDDIEWCKSYDSEFRKHTTKNMIYYNNSDELIIMCMMSRCIAGAIISSSTFSIWGAILGADMNPHSTIVYSLYPADFPTKKNPMEFPERWIGI